MLQAQIYIDLEEIKGEQPLHDYIIKFLLERDIAGATSFRGYAGFGKNHKIKYPREIFSFDEPPVMIVFTDEEQKVRNVVTELKEMLPSKTIIVMKVEKI